MLGIGPAAVRKEDATPWWAREEYSSSNSSTRLVISQPGTQGELWGEDGNAVAPSLTLPRNPPAAQKTTEVELVTSKGIARRRKVATTRTISTAVDGEAVQAASTAQPAARVMSERAGLAFHLVRARSISSGQEEGRWFSVPHRPLLPRYRLFVGANPVQEDSNGRIHLEPHSMKTHRGNVWFV